MIVIDERRKLVAQKITEFLKANDRFAKTIVFCIDIEHAEGMRSALANANADLVKQNNKYVMQITGDNDEGKRELHPFQNEESRYPVLVTTSKLSIHTTPPHKSHQQQKKLPFSSNFQNYYINLPTKPNSLCNFFRL